MTCSGVLRVWLSGCFQIFCFIFSWLVWLLCCFLYFVHILALGLSVDSVAVVFCLEGILLLLLLYLLSFFSGCASAKQGKYRISRTTNYCSVRVNVFFVCVCFKHYKIVRIKIICIQILHYKQLKSVSIIGPFWLHTKASYKALHSSAIFVFFG